MKRRSGQRNRVPQVSSLRPGKQQRAATQPDAGRSVLVQIEKPIYGGNFLAHDQGKAVFVPLVLPGEQARVRVLDEKRGFDTAEVEELVGASAQRIEPRCPHFGACGGCQYQHAGYDTQLRIKQDVLRETLQRGGVRPPEDIEVLAGEPWAYRNRIRLALDAHGNPGYRGRRSHAVVPISECPIAAPLLVRTALAAAEAMRTVAPDLHPSEMALFCDPDETALLLTVFVARPAKIRFDEFAIQLRERIPELAGAELVIEGGMHQAPRTLARWGETSLAYPAAGVHYRVDHGAFFQVNRWLVDALVERVTAGYSGGLAWDLFAGVGLFARQLAESFARVVAVESAPASTDALAANLAGTAGEAVQASSLDFLRRHRRGERPDLIVVDPPRTGLGADITALIAECAPPALVYVSCDPATLARDLRALLAAGYAIESVTLADLFPQTFHLETVVRMRLP
jgi:23S rRNA (uracil1939-C5)-methyltransferase